MIKILDFLFYNFKQVLSAQDDLLLFMNLNVNKRRIQSIKIKPFCSMPMKLNYG